MTRSAKNTTGVYSTNRILGTCGTKVNGCGEHSLVLFVAVREGVHVGVMEQGVVAVPPRELTLVLLVAIREGVDVAVVEEGVVAISPGELLYKGAGFYDKRCVGRDCIRRRRPYISSGQTSFLVK